MSRSIDLVKIIETHLRNGDRSATSSAMAAELAVQPRTVLIWIESGLPSTKLGRTHWVLWQDLADWIESRSPKPPAPKHRPNGRAAKWLASRGMKVTG